VEARDCLFSTSVQTGRGVQPTSSKMRNEIILGRKVAEVWCWPHSTLEWQDSEESNDASTYLLCLRGRLRGECYTWWHCGFFTKYLFIFGYI